jgi:geranylgeranyl pyrophosphate synthase
VNAASGIEDLLDRERLEVDEVLAGIAAGSVARVADPIRAPMEYALSTSGKRVRPILCLAAYRAVAGREPARAMYRLACAPEIVHTYSLVHDDLPCMDDDELRRGRPTVHRVYGAALATLAGAALLPLAIEVVLESGSALGLGVGKIAGLVRELCRAAGAGGMVGGQLLDLQAEGGVVDVAQLEAIHRAKTGALLASSLRIGALAAGADEGQLASLTRYGEALGLAFQITDDVLDVTGDACDLGKTAGRDEALHKASYPSLFGIEGARARGRACVEAARAAVAGFGRPELLELADYVVDRRA